MNYTESNMLSRAARSLEGIPQDELVSRETERALRRLGAVVAGAGVAVIATVGLTIGARTAGEGDITPISEEKLAQIDDPNTAGFGVNGEPLTAEEYEETFDN